MRFMSIDPGLAATGWATWVGENLQACGLARSDPKKPLTYRILSIVDQVLGEEHPALRVVERMIVRGGRNKGNPQILCDLNLLSGALGTAWVAPHEWKGLLSKEIHQPRILATLTPEELALVMAVKPPSLRHNTIDAVGIGLYHLGRLTPKTTRLTRPSGKGKISP